MQPARYHEVFDHTADLGIRVRAGSLSGLFEEAALALSSVIVEKLDQVRPRRQKSFRLQADQLEFLLHDWLSEILYCFELEGLVLSRFAVKTDGKGLRAVCRGEALSGERHQLSHEVKAVTYHGLKVEAIDQGWLAEIILDI